MMKRAPVDWLRAVCWIEVATQEIEKTAIKQVYQEAWLVIITKLWQVGLIMEVDVVFKHI